MNDAQLEILGNTLAQAAMRIVAKLPEAKNASPETLDAACAAMREAARPALNALLDDAKAAPWMAQMAFQSAALSIAQAGIEAIKTSIQ